MTSEVSTGQHVAAGLARIALALRQRAWAEAQPRDLTPTQAGVLGFLWSREPATLGQVAEQLAVRPPTASEAVSALVAKGLVHKAADGGDGRRLSLRLTADGRRVAEGSRVWPEFLAATVEQLAPQEQGALLRLLQKLVRGLQERGEVPLTRMCATCTYFRPQVHADPRRPHHCAFMDRAFGDPALRFDCADHTPAEPARWAAIHREFDAVST